MSMERGKQHGTGSSSSTRSGFAVKMRCNCGREAVVRTVKNGPNVGMKFHSCPLWPDPDCGFFKWIGGGNEVTDDLHYQLFDKDTTIAELELRKNLMEDKVKKLQLKKDKLEEEIQKSARNEKNIFMAFVFSWVLFGIVVAMYLK